MCSAKEWIQSPPPTHHSNGRQKHPPSRRSKVRVQRLIIRRRNHERLKTAERDMELMNLKLYLENRCILEENEKLRQKALCLRQENQALLSQFQNKFSFSQLPGSKLD